MCQASLRVAAEVRAPRAARRRRGPHPGPPPAEAGGRAGTRRGRDPALGTADWTRQRSIDRGTGSGTVGVAACPRWSARGESLRHRGEPPAPGRASGTGESLRHRGKSSGCRAPRKGPRRLAPGRRRPPKRSTRGRAAGVPSSRHGCRRDGRPILTPGEAAAPPPAPSQDGPSSTHCPVDRPAGWGARRRRGWWRLRPCGRACSPRPPRRPRRR